MIRLLKILLSLAFLAYSQLDADECKSPIYTQYVAEITRNFAIEIKKEFGFACQGSGGSMPFDVERMDVMFLVHQRATIEEARELEVKLTEKFVQAINAHEKIRPYLREFPFPVHRTKVGISFLKQNNKPYLDGSVAYVSQIKNTIYYRAEDPLNPNVYKHIKEEPYEEARAIVLNQPSSPE